MDKNIKYPPQVAIIMGSDSDLPCMKNAASILEKFDIPYELTIVSAHRTPSRLYSYARSADLKGLECIIAGAGGARSFTRNGCFFNYFTCYWCTS